MDIERLDYADPGDRLHSFHAIAAADEEPGPVSSFPRFAVVAEHGWVAQPGETYVARLDSQIVGGVAVHFPGPDNAHAALLRIFHVGSAHRRQGIGTALLEHAIARARAHDRQVIFAEARPDSPGGAFAREHGFEAASAQARRILDLTAVDWNAYEKGVASLSPDYILDRWQDAAPDDLVDDAATLMAAMNDAPTDGMDVEPIRWDAARVRTFEAGWAKAQQTAYTTVARHRATGHAVGFTRIIADNTPDGWGRQTDTAVLREHRGHHLGLIMKQANTTWFHNQEPTATRIITWNAVTNARMIAINERLGYQLLDVWNEWQLSL
ncbi:N-acetyltransferase [Acrocarpospora pleiomorpha]|uniref:N-acetyltransferase n=1 Tax=Acrocarpospora pleiomorpha TaxID=90975 RepID=A0A5M3XVG2_9ACTN|nr:GNAT family N-acetyltransferase [Acrocarpospora pleiomorpha]GES23303.1 N-acetyltransferase [Acrocarpospora pleiomorpha]